MKRREPERPRATDHNPCIPDRHQSGFADAETRESTGQRMKIAQ
jgi:hypothetical protein